MTQGEECVATWNGSGWVLSPPYERLCGGCTTICRATRDRAALESWGYRIVGGPEHVGPRECAVQPVKVANWHPASAVWRLTPPHPMNETTKLSATSDRTTIPEGYVIFGGPLVQPEPWEARLARLARESLAADAEHERLLEAVKVAKAAVEEAEAIADRASKEAIRAANLYKRTSAREAVVQSFLENL